MTRQILRVVQCGILSGSGHLAVLIVLFGVLISVSQPKNPKSFGHAEENIVASSHKVLNFLTCSKLLNSRRQLKKRGVRYLADYL